MTSPHDVFLACAVIACAWLAMYVVAASLIRHD
jgi:hypothetical protein